MEPLEIERANAKASRPISKFRKLVSFQLESFGSAERSAGLGNVPHTIHERRSTIGHIGGYANPRYYWQTTGRRKAIVQICGVLVLGTFVTIMATIAIHVVWKDQTSLQHNSRNRPPSRMPVCGSPLRFDVNFGHAGRIIAKGTLT